MHIDTDFPPGIGRVGQFMRLVADFERDEIEAAVDGFIAMLDERDGDPDVEPNGDEADTGVVEFHPREPAYRAEMRDAAAAAWLEDSELDGDEEDHGFAEDDFVDHRSDGPGCPISDIDHGAEEMSLSGGGDPSWTEWQTRGRHKVDSHGAEVVGRDRHGNMLHEDAEDDDPVEDDDSDRCAAGDDHIIASLPTPTAPSRTAGTATPAPWPAARMIGSRTATRATIAFGTRTHDAGGPRAVGDDPQPHRPRGRDR